MKTTLAALMLLSLVALPALAQTTDNPDVGVKADMNKNNSDTAPADTSRSGANVYDDNKSDVDNTPVRHKDKDTSDMSTSSTSTTDTTRFDSNTTQSTTASTDIDRTSRLPRTASPLPLYELLGAASGAAAALSALRRRLR